MPDIKLAPVSSKFRMFIKLYGQRNIAQQIGCSEASVSKWKSGERVPSARRIRELIVLSRGVMTADDIVGVTRPKENPNEGNFELFA